MEASISTVPVTTAIWDVFLTSQVKAESDVLSREARSGLVSAENVARPWYRSAAASADQGTHPWAW